MALSKETKLFIDALIEKKIKNVTELIYQSLNSQESMNLKKKLNEIDKLKGWLDSFRPLAPYGCGGNEKDLRYKVYL